ncbi:M3 family oligoendopeptidase [Geosporobacter ferrireducens]|uniref:Oligoendopeptidase F n=1 Tax=Geosporobacter ferrireducens TaxID=1424294 RepID=A0A1D8GDW2_9FIRM|nr:M3 family oligoendopeptidase [Geosporobacter ferrireducens]AOT69052.1 oligoendopeptidase F [Geosporobacter ferrireducens]MTI56721.1 M3 family oligoendopeptidase [Geosporobacter ferrireducens]
MRWNLDALYPSFSGENFKEDLKSCREMIDKMKEWTEKHLCNDENSQKKMETFLHMENEFLQQFTRIYNFAELTLSVEAKNETAMQVVEQLENDLTELTKPQVLFQKWLAALENLEELISASKFLKEHEYYLQELCEKSQYLLSEQEELLIAKMKNTGSGAWTKLQELLTSTLLVDIEKDGETKQLPLPVVRNMAYEGDPAIRRNAYDAELKAYEKIEVSSAACLNGIKGEVITLSKIRGYASPLKKTLLDSRMEQETLEAMLAAIQEKLPSFHRYYQKKAELLGHGKGLPFYDLFAPMGEVNMRFSYEEARAFIVNNFKSFSNRLSDYAEKAFERQWIDAEPREGKRGGAFCANLHSIKESRILANFTGSFNDVMTLAHELGHGYHGECLKEETHLNSDYPMPIAETASIFCETIIKDAALKQASKEESFSILESSLSGAGQVIVDIYSRYLFESELFYKRESGSLSVRELKEMMLEAQRLAYGQGLDHQWLHPYMWVVKPHYYSAEYNFYNFPYAFGLLFAKGLYAKYLEMGSEFVEIYDKLLAVTGKNSIAAVGRIVDVDVRSKDFWLASLRLLEADIEKFIALK